MWAVHPIFCNGFSVMLPVGELALALDPDRRGLLLATTLKIGDQVKWDYFLVKTTCFLRQLFQIDRLAGPEQVLP